MGSTASNVELGLEPSVESGPLAEPLRPEVGADPAAEEPLAGKPLAEEPLADEVLVEEISIDGMCGVY